MAVKRETGSLTLCVLVTTASILLPNLLSPLTHSIGFRYYVDRSYIWKGLGVCVLCKVILNYYIYYVVIKSYTIITRFYADFWFLIWLSFIVGLFIEYYLIAWFFNRYFLINRFPDIRWSKNLTCWAGEQPDSMNVMFNLNTY